MSEGRGGIDWKGLFVDKSIDLFLIPLGLFGALWLQSWVEAKKEKGDYAALIGDFTTEVGQNHDKVERLEVVLGPMTETSPEKVLGPLQVELDTFKTESEQLSVVFDCIDDYIDASLKRPALLEVLTPMGAPAPTPAATDPPVAAAPEEEPEARPDPAAAKEELAEVLGDCAKVLDDAAKRKPARPRAIDLSATYQYVVWQVYLSNGIKLFKDPQAKGLGLQLGQAYASQREVEARLDDIEELFNDTLMKSAGRLAALVSESSELVTPDSEPDELKAAHVRIKEMSLEAFGIRYELDNVRSVITLKVGRLKDYVVKMNTHLDEVKAQLVTETARVGTGL
jgi:hypothetical protein